MQLPFKWNRKKRRMIDVNEVSNEIGVAVVIVVGNDSTVTMIGMNNQDDIGHDLGNVKIVNVIKTEIVNIATGKNDRIEKKIREKFYFILKIIGNHHHRRNHHHVNVIISIVVKIETTAVPVVITKGTQNVITKGDTDNLFIKNS